ncbi:spermidine synthase [Aquimarina sp. RZ0]|uniref:spermidine synthase n=1 Tax=Aquimarina sp. RZ0 TaxID=2607730 RepID=UPI0011F22FF9|nr:fused MFS/spermidine synthase [Aquimarina sp. RZ0]KAA1248181.1 spermine synthase [Aquimarina sp. RZ0]
MKQLLSYLWPVTKKTKSRINGSLEITWINGKKVLDTKNANYSYGTLQKILSYSLSKINISSSSEILLLGLGGGSVIQSLREDFKHIGKITAIEIDPVIINIAAQEFNIIPNHSLEIICDDALTYVDTCKNTYELIIIDIFIDNTVPQAFYEIALWEKLISLLKPQGYILFNAGIYLKEKDKLNDLKSTFASQLVFTSYENILGTNTILIGEKSLK